MVFPRLSIAIHRKSGNETRMENPSQRPQPSRSPLLEWVCENVLPNCEKAISLAETGVERPLTAMERAGLKYHGRLCPFCGCAEGKFTATRERYEKARKADGSGPTTP